jgi:hypothetical protein
MLPTLNVRICSVWSLLYIQIRKGVRNKEKLESWTSLIFNFLKNSKHVTFSQQNELNAHPMFQSTLSGFNANAYLPNFGIARLKFPDSYFPYVNCCEGHFVPFIHSVDSLWSEQVILSKWERRGEGISAQFSFSSLSQFRGA